MPDLVTRQQLEVGCSNFELRKNLFYRRFGRITLKIDVLILCSTIATARWVDLTQATLTLAHQAQQKIYQQIDLPHFYGHPNLQKYSMGSKWTCIQRNFQLGLNSSDSKTKWSTVFLERWPFRSRVSSTILQSLSSAGNGAQTRVEHDTSFKFFDFFDSGHPKPDILIEQIPQLAKDAESGTDTRLEKYFYISKERNFKFRFQIQILKQKP